MNRLGRGSFSRSTPSTSYGGSQRSQNNSDDYWKKLFEGTDYEDLYNSIINSYGVAPPSTFWGALTGQNKTNAYQHEMSKRDELAALAEKMYNEEYSSYSNQVQQMIQAGLNPDLLGVSNAGGSSEMSPDGVNQNIKAENGLGVVGSLASVAMSAVGLGQSILSSMGNALSLDSMRLDNLNKLDTFALSYILDNIDPRSVVDGSLADDSRHSLIASASAFASRVYGMNRRQSRQFTSSVARQIDSPKFFQEYYGFMSRGASSRKSYISDTSGDNYSDTDEVMRILYGEIITAQQNASKSRHKYESDYYSNRDAVGQADSENVTDVFSAESSRRGISDTQEYMNNNAFRKQINKKLGDAFDNGNIFAGIVLSLINEFLGLGGKPMNFGPSGVKGAMEMIGGLK